MAKFGFSVDEVDMTSTAGNYDPIPEGEYVLKALEAEEKGTKAGGTMIKVKFEVVSGEFAGRLIWFNFNTVNSSQKAQDIGRRQAVEWAIACGKPDVDDTDKLIDKKFSATVNIEKGTGGYSDSNSIRNFLAPAAGSTASASKPTPAKPAAGKPAPAAGKGKNPWDD